MSVASLDYSLFPENETAMDDVDLRSVLRTVLETNAKQEARITSLEGNCDQLNEMFTSESSCVHLKLTFDIDNTDKIETKKIGG